MAADSTGREGASAEAATPSPSPPRITGIICPECHQPYVVESLVPQMIVSHCHGCGHHWVTTTARAAGARPQDAPPVRQRMSRGAVISGLVVLGVIVTGLIVPTALGRFRGRPSGAISAAALEQLAEDQGRGLPRMVDSDTELFAVEASGRVLIFDQRLVNLSDRDVQTTYWDQLRPALLDTACRTSNLRQTFLEAGVTIRWAYYDRDRQYLDAIDVTPADCGL